MNTYELLKSLVGCTVVEKENGVIEITPSVNKEAEECNFVEGDFVYCEDPETSKKWVAIVDSVINGDVYVKAMLICNIEINSILTRRYILCDATDKTLRYATEEEKQMLLDALRKDGKVWNSDTKQIEDNKFKEGDFLCFEGHYGSTWYLILKDVNSNKVMAHWSLDSTGKIINRTHEFCDAEEASYLKRATPEQEEVILKALYDERKVWNPDTKQIEEDRTPRVGDLCVFWDEGYDGATVSTLHDIHSLGNIYYTKESGTFEYCVRFQDFDFETMQPKDEE